MRSHYHVVRFDGKISWRCPTYAEAKAWYRLYAEYYGEGYYTIKEVHVYREDDDYENED